MHPSAAHTSTVNTGHNGEYARGLPPRVPRSVISIAASCDTGLALLRVARRRFLWILAAQPMFRVVSLVR